MCLDQIYNNYVVAMQNSIMTGMDFNRGTTNLMTVSFAFQDPLKQNLSVLRQLMAVDVPIKMVCEQALCTHLHLNICTRVCRKCALY